MRSTSTTLATVAILAVGVTLSGCGGSDGGTSGESSSGNSAGTSAEDWDYPACKDVWVDGETIDLNTYAGCQDGDTVIAAVTSGCYDAKNQYLGQVATYEDRLWVVQEGTDQKTGEGGTPGQVTDVNPGC